MSEITSRLVEAQSKAPPLSDWDRHRPLISKLYQQKPLSEVVRILAEEQGFHATSRQYKSRLKAWCLQKRPTAAPPDRAPPTHPGIVVNSWNAENLSPAQDLHAAESSLRQDAVKRKLPEEFNESILRRGSRIVPAQSTRGLEIRWSTPSHASGSWLDHHDTAAPVDSRSPRHLESLDSPLSTSESPKPLEEIPDSQVWSKGKPESWVPDERRRLSCALSRPSSRETRNVACPFYKKDPVYYSLHNKDNELAMRYRTCAGPGWDSISRLKQHISRVHVARNQCLVCGEFFDRVHNLRFHAVKCWPSDLKLPASSCSNGITDAEMEQLKRTRANLDVASTWRQMYQILFSSVSLIPSPYYDNESEESMDVHVSLPQPDAVSSLSEHLRGTLPEKVLEGVQKQPPPQARAGTEASGSVNRIESSESQISIRPQDLKSVVSDAVAKTCAEWRENHDLQKDTRRKDHPYMATRRRYTQSKLVIQSPHSVGLDVAPSFSRVRALTEPCRHHTSAGMEDGLSAGLGGWDDALGNGNVRPLGVSSTSISTEAPIPPTSSFAITRQQHAPGNSDIGSYRFNNNNNNHLPTAWSEPYEVVDTSIYPWQAWDEFPEASCMSTLPDSPYFTPGSPLTDSLHCMTNKPITLFQPADYDWQNIPYTVVGVDPTIGPWLQPGQYDSISSTLAEYGPYLPDDQVRDG